MRSRPVLFVIFLALAISPGGMAEPSRSCKPDYFTVADFAAEPSVWAPDHSKRIRLLKDLTIRVESNGKDLGPIVLPDDPANAWIKWSEDSRAFYITVGGNAISGQTIAYAVTADKLKELPAPKIIADEFAQHHFCRTRGNNLYAIRWEQNSKMLLLMAEVYGTGDCGKEMSFSEGYLVDADSGAILKTYDAKKIRAMHLACWPDELLNLEKKSK